MAAVITLVHGGGDAVADAVLLARAIGRIIREDLGWPFGYNLLLVRLAAAGILPPALAAVAIATSSVTVVGNAPWLRRFHATVSHARARQPHPRRRIRAGQSSGICSASSKPISLAASSSNWASGFQPEFLDVAM